MRDDTMEDGHRAMLETLARAEPARLKAEAEAAAKAAAAKGKRRPPLPAERG